MGSSTFFRAALAAGAIVAATSTAQAGTVTDAYLNIGGGYALSGNHFTFGGTATGMVSGDPTAERAYNLDLSADLDAFGLPVFSFDETVSAGTLTQIPGLDPDGNGAFSLVDAYGVADALLAEFDLDDELAGLFGSFEPGTEYSKSFSFKFDRDEVAGVFCSKFGAPHAVQTMSFGGGQKDCLPAFGAGDFNLGLALTYETGGETPAPIPLPAALPLLAAGLGGLGFVRRFRKSRG